MTDKEVQDLREAIFEDGKVTKEEVITLWDKKDSQETTSSEFDSLFAEAVLAYVGEDGKIDDEEAQFLIDKIGEDGTVDDAEDELLEAIADWASEEGHEVSGVLVDAFPEYFADDSEEGDEEE